MAVIPIICDHTAGRGQIFFVPRSPKKWGLLLSQTEWFKRILKQIHTQALNVYYIYLHVP